MCGDKRYLSAAECGCACVCVPVLWVVQGFTQSLPQIGWEVWKGEVVRSITGNWHLRLTSSLSSKLPSTHTGVAMTGYTVLHTTMEGVDTKAHHICHHTKPHWRRQTPPWWGSFGQRHQFPVFQNAKLLFPFLSLSQFSSSISSIWNNNGSGEINSHQRTSVRRLSLFYILYNVHCT